MFSWSGSGEWLSCLVALSGDPVHSLCSSSESLSCVEVVSGYPVGNDEWLVFTLLSLSLLVADNVNNNIFN